MEIKTPRKNQGKWGFFRERAKAKVGCCTVMSEGVSCQGIDMYKKLSF